MSKQPKPAPKPRKVTTREGGSRTVKPKRDKQVKEKADE